MTGTSGRITEADLPSTDKNESTTVLHAHLLPRFLLMQPRLGRAEQPLHPRDLRLQLIRLRTNLP